MVPGFEDSAYPPAWRPGEAVDCLELADWLAAGFCAQGLPQAEVDVLADETDGAVGHHQVDSALVQAAGGKAARGRPLLAFVVFVPAVIGRRQR